MAMVLIMAGVGCTPDAGEPLALSDEEQVAARAQERWNALVDGALEDAYLKESPAFREAYTLRAYRGRFGHQLRWIAAEVAEVAVDGDMASVRVMVSYVSLGPDGRPMEGERPLEEAWLREEGEWWYVSK